MENVGDFDKIGQEEDKWEPKFSNNHNGELMSPADSEMLPKKTYETDPNRGMELLFHWYYRPLCSHAIRYVSSKEIAEDIVSDIFYKFHTEQTFNDIAISYRAYLFTRVRHRAFDYVRVEMKRSTSIQYADYAALQCEQPAHMTQYEDLYKDVENAINTQFNLEELNCDTWKLFKTDHDGKNMKPYHTLRRDVNYSKKD